MSPTWWSGPPPHERGLTSLERQLRASANPDYEYCVIVRNHDMRSGRVWFTAKCGQTVVGRSRVIARKQGLSGDLERSDREMEAVRQALVESLLRNGWGPADGDFHGELVFCRPRTPPGSKSRR